MGSSCRSLYVLCVSAWLLGIWSHDKACDTCAGIMRVQDAWLRLDASWHAVDEIPTFLCFSASVPDIFYNMGSSFVNITLLLRNSKM